MWKRFALALLAVGAAVALSSVVSIGASTSDTVVEFVETASQVAETDGTHTLTIVGALDRTGSIAVEVTSVDGTALAGTDYVAISQSIEFSDTVPVHDITVEIIDDAESEADETFVVQLVSDKGHVLGERSTHTVTILTSDGRSNRPPEIDMVGKQSVVEGETLDVTVSASDPDAEPVTLTITPELEEWATFVDHGDGTATLTASPGADDSGSYGPYTIVASDGSLTTTRPMLITVLDAADEPDPDPAPPTITPTHLTAGSVSNTLSTSTAAVSTTAGTLTLVSVTSTADMDPAAVLRADGVTFSLVTAVATGDTAPRQLSVYQTTDALNGPITITVAPDKNIRWSVDNFGAAEIVQAAQSSYAITGNTTVATVALDAFATPHNVTYATAFTQVAPQVESGYTILASEGGEATLTAAWHEGEDLDPTWSLQSAHWIMAALEIGPAGG